MAAGVSAGAKLALVGLALFLLSKKAKAKGSVVATSTGVEVPRKSSYEGDVATWAKVRYAAALAEVTKRGEDNAQNAKDIALSVLAHWSIETGAGASEWNFNVANITAVSSETYFTATDISGVKMQFAAYDSLAAGVKAYFDALSGSRYKAAAALLGTDPTSYKWYVALGKAGWFDPTKAKPPSTWDAAAALWDTKRANLAQYAAG
jgi:hypothetical protein